MSLESLSPDFRTRLYFVTKSSEYCKKCRRKVKGDMFIVPYQSVKSVDGSMAHPVLWVCNDNYHHIRKLGYNKPVDFTESAGPDMMDERTGEPGFDATDDQWCDYVYEQTKKEEALKKEMTRKITF